MYDYDDFSIIPAITSNIRSRSEITIDEDGFYPLITAPMDTVIDDNNKDIFRNNKIRLCLSRGMWGNNKYGEFESISLEDAETLSFTKSNKKDLFCIDIANGHMDLLLTIIENFKIKRPHTKLIVGNIANPETFRVIANIGVWGVRVGIGGGNACTTSANAAIHYPLGSLIEECGKIKEQEGFETRIIADGGIKKFSDIIKALALGADIVMIGSLFNKSIESAGKTYLYKKIGLKNKKLIKFLLKHKLPLYKKYRGMSTKAVQKKWGRKKLRTSEGVEKWNRVEYSLSTWTDNFSDYLRSAMSYTNSRNLREFKKSKKIIISERAFNRFNK